MIRWSGLKTDFISFLILLQVCIPAFSTVYRSNGLMMALEELPHATSSGYELEIDGDVGILYLDGTEVARRTVSDGSVVLSGSDGSQVVSRYDGDGRLVYRSDSGIETRYAYDGRGILSSATFTGPDGLVGVNEYFHTPEGTITRIDSYQGGVYLLPSSSVFSFSIGDDSGVFTKDGAVSDPVVEDGEKSGFTPLPDGGVRVSRSDGTIVEYDGSGRIVATSGAGSSVSYSYDGQGNIMMVSSTFEDRKVVEEYSQGGLVSRMTEYDDGRTVEERFDNGTRVETRYRDKEPYVRIVYDEDMSTVREVVRL